jgi:peptidoglycan hydrolase CwlO-like protein
MFFGYMSRWIFDLLGRDKDKRRFIILFTMLTVGMGMNVVNAQSIREYGGKLEEHSTKLHDLDSKFEIFVAYISTQSEKDKEQDERITKQGERIKVLETTVKESKEPKEGDSKKESKKES